MNLAGGKDERSLFRIPPRDDSEATIAALFQYLEIRESLLEESDEPNFDPAEFRSYRKVTQAAR